MARNILQDEFIRMQDLQAHNSMTRIILNEYSKDYLTPRGALNLLRKIGSSLPTLYTTYTIKILDELEKTVDAFEKTNSSFQLPACKMTPATEVTQKISIPVDFRRIEASGTHYPVVCIETNKWLNAQQWLIKLEWDNNYKINLPKPNKDASKKDGILLSRFLRLCERCHTYQEEVQVDIPFLNASHWLRIIFTELIAEDILSVCFQTPPKIYNNNIKEALLSKDKQRLSELKNYNNPFKDTPWCARWILIDAAIELSQSSERFYVEYWKPFLKAYSDRISDLKGLGKTYFQENGKVYQRTGRGKGKKLLGTASSFKHLCSQKPC